MTQQLFLVWCWVPTQLAERPWVGSVQGTLESSLRPMMFVTTLQTDWMGLPAAHYLEILGFHPIDFSEGYDSTSGGVWLLCSDWTTVVGVRLCLMYGCCKQRACHIAEGHKAI